LLPRGGNTYQQLFQGEIRVAKGESPPKERSGREGDSKQGGKKKTQLLQGRKNDVKKKAGKRRQGRGGVGNLRVRKGYQLVMPLEILSSKKGKTLELHSSPTNNGKKKLGTKEYVPKNFLEGPTETLHADEIKRGEESWTGVRAKWRAQGTILNSSTPGEVGEFWEGGGLRKAIRAKKGQATKDTLPSMPIRAGKRLQWDLPKR